MDTAAQWPPQDIVVKQMEEIVTCPKAASAAASERKVRPHKEEALNCPRCNSSNTKFCYYNNYSLSQPRYFCKTCRRYWTEGGSLRNIPVGGGSRKNKRSSSSSSTSSTSSNSSSKKLPHLIPPHPNPTSKILQTQDLNLGFSIHHDFNDMIHLPNYENAPTKPNPSSSSSPPSHHHLSSLELLTGLTGSRGLSSFMPPLPVATSTDPTSVVYSSDFPSLPDFKPSLNFSLDGLGSNYATFQGVQETNGKLLFPFEDLKQVSANANEADHQHNRDHQHGAASTGYWNGVIGGGSW